MAERKTIDPSLAKTILREMAAGALREPFEFLIAHAATVDGFQLECVVKDGVAEFQYTAGVEQPYAFSIGRGALHFNFRALSGLRSPAADLEQLRERFDKVEATEQGEITVQLRTIEDAMAIVHGVFGPGFRRVEFAPRLHTYAQVRVLAQDLADLYLHGTDDAPLSVARSLAKHPPGAAATLAVTIAQFLPDDEARTRFGEFLLLVSQGKVRSVFAGYMDPD